MIKYEITTDNNLIYVFLESNSSNERAQLVYEGDSNSIEELKTFLEESCSGAFGHIIGQATTAIDLHYAMSNQKQFQVKLLEGQGFVTKYDPKIPEGAVT